MISRNLPLREDPRGYYIELSRLDRDELRELAQKHDGQVNVRISRPVSPGSEEQNRAMHALLAEYYKTGMHSARGDFAESLAAFKVWVKMQYGPCYCVDMDGQVIRVPKSWADYTKQERMGLIDGLISEINQSGAFAASEKIREIIEGMQNSWKEK